jgi:hypothetical protein
MLPARHKIRSKSLLATDAHVLQVFIERTQSITQRPKPHRDQISTRVHGDTVDIQQTGTGEQTDKCTMKELRGVPLRIACHDA